MTQEQLNEILESHKKWLNNEDGGAKANLRGADLRGANLIYANLRSANLGDADLSYTDLSYTNLRGTDLEGANLRGANLYNTNLIYANLRSANLGDADLSYTDLRYATLRGANLIYANLGNATGNNQEVKSLQLGKYYITILVGIKIHIGCQNHTVEQWENFTDEEISKMDDGALEWWKEWKEVILKVAKGNK